MHALIMEVSCSSNMYLFVCFACLFTLQANVFTWRYLALNGCSGISMSSFPLIYIFGVFPETTCSKP